MCEELKVQGTNRMARCGPLLAHGWLLLEVTDEQKGQFG